MAWEYKAYGKIHTFRTKKAILADAEEWMMNTEGSEQSRACRVLQGVEAGERFVDTDAPERYPA